MKFLFFIFLMLSLTEVYAGEGNLYEQLQAFMGLTKKVDKTIDKAIEVKTEIDTTVEKINNNGKVKQVVAFAKKVKAEGKEPPKEVQNFFNEFKAELKKYKEGTAKEIERKCQ